MTREERMQYNNAINVIDYRLICKRCATVPNADQLQAIHLAIGAMQRRMEEKNLPLGKHIAVLQYHIKQPTATIFKDSITLEALEQGIMAMKWLTGQDTYDINGVQI